MRSWYELRNDSGVVLTVGEIEGDTALTNISTDTLQPAAHVQLSAGYWVNRFRRFPSCHGRIATKAAPASSQLVDSGSQDLHTVVRRQAGAHRKRTGQSADAAERAPLLSADAQRAGLRLWAIATYSVGIDHRIDSLRTVAKHLLAIQPGERLSLRRVIRYKLVRSAQGKRIYNKECELWSDEEDGYVVVQLPHHHTPVGIVTHMGIGDGKEAIAQRQGEAQQEEGGQARRPHDPRLPGIYTGQLDSLEAAERLRATLGTPRGILRGPFRGGTARRLRILYRATPVLAGGRMAKGRLQRGKTDLQQGAHLRHRRVAPPTRAGRKMLPHRLGPPAHHPSRHAERQAGKGKVDYPVSFAYVKSTEGCTVFNAYYDDDYRDARKAGIRTGTYHFFSLTSGGQGAGPPFPGEEPLPQRGICRPCSTWSPRTGRSARRAERR